MHVLSFSNFVDSSKLSFVWQPKACILWDTKSYKMFKTLLMSTGISLFEMMYKMPVAYWFFVWEGYIGKWKGREKVLESLLSTAKGKKIFSSGAGAIV